MLINGALSSWNMKNSPANGGSTEEPTEWQIVPFWRLLSVRKTLQRNLRFARDPISAIVADGVSRCIKKMGRTGLLFVENGVKVNEAYYRDVLLLHHYAAGHTSLRRRVLHILAGPWSGAPGSSWDDLERETPAFISPYLWPPTAPTSIQLTTKSGAWCSNESTRRKCRSWTIWGSINSGWRDAMEQGVIDSAINQWRRHRRACVQAKGGHFEYCDLLFSLICTVKICR